MTVFHAAPDVLAAMLKKAEGKLKVAAKNLENGFFGDASSRAYYAVFHAISAVLASKGLTFSSHAQVIGAFNREFIKTGSFPAETTRKLQRLFEDRQVSDYDCLEEIDKTTAQTDLQHAQEIINACRNYLNSHP